MFASKELHKFLFITVQRSSGLGTTKGTTKGQLGRLIFDRKTLGVPFSITTYLLYKVLFEFQFQNL